MEYITVSIESSCQDCQLPLQLHAVWVPISKVEAFALALSDSSVDECIECSEITWKEPDA